MSTATTSTRVTTGTTRTTNPFAGAAASARAELLRLRKWPAVWVTIGAWLALTVMFGFLFNYVSYKTGDTSFSNEGVTRQSLLDEVLPANVPHVLIQGMPMFGGALMLVLGALVAGNGYGWGTWKTVLTQGPARPAVVTGSFAALTVFVVTTVVATLALCFGLALLIAGVESQTVVWPTLSDTAKSTGVGFLVMEMWALLGFLLGTVARGPALSVGLGLVWALVVENLLRGVGQLLGPVEAFTKILPGTAGGSLVGSIVGTGGPDPTPGVLDTLSGSTAMIVLGAYLVLTPLLAGWLVTRRDVA
ncbi:MAG TPA: ABC transporter permease [Nocardioides sp.]|uniref:ABC transporter permease n=1 Tax=Nocardioides sp. TaxID=35761 RepID=UPI002E37D924|nr:ABC transporter permease [Nocardioides sp.]HEX5089210.1 ABC transporter permease [Nocardioides sp.]